MVRYFLARVLGVIPLLLAVSIISFGLLGILEIRGNVAESILGQGAADPRAVKLVEAELGLNRPLPVQFLHWLGKAVQGNFGDSLKNNGVPVTRMIGQHIGPTMSIVAFALILGSLVGIVLGVRSGIKPGSRTDRVLTFFSASMIAAPGFVLAMLLIYVFAVKLGWFKPTGYVAPGQSVWGWFKSITLPSVALAMPVVAIVQRQLRSSMSSSLQSRYVLAARARGVPARTVVRRHAMRNALVPTVTVIGFQVSAAIGLTIAVEQVFAIPGMGSMLTEAIQARDITVVQGTLMVAALIVAVVNILIDLSYAWLNPKVRFE